MQSRVREAAAKKRLFLGHAIRQLNKGARMSTAAEVREVVLQADEIEDYRADVRGHRCLLSGATSRGRIIHVVCSPKADYIAIITAYIPDPAEWDETRRQRRKETR